MTKFKATDEQVAIFDVVESGDNAVVEAGAGSGKTTTAREATALTPNRRMLCVMYNRAAAEEARASFPKHVKCSTIHGLAYGAVGRLYEQRLNSPHEPAYVVAGRLGVRDRVQVTRDREFGPSQLVSCALAMVDRFCYSADDEITKWHLPPVPGVPTVEQITALHTEAARLHQAGEQRMAQRVKAEWQQAVATYNQLADAVVPIARRVWADLQNPHEGAVRFQHDHYLKMWQLRRPRLRYDTVILDEAQDSNPCRSSLLLAQHHAQLIAIGDSCQQLYAWQGAVDALATWPAEHRLWLTQSWRFGPAVAEEANKWLTLLDAVLRVKGNPNLRSVLVDEMDAPDAVLCRTNAGAIGEVLAALEAGRRPALAGGTKELVALAKAAGELKAGLPTSHHELYTFATWQEVQEYAEESTGSDLRVLVSLVDKYGPDKLLTALAATSDESGADLTVCTTHKSKGLEWPRVKVANDFPEPETDARGHESYSQDEAMLAYVAVTRAQRELKRGSLAVVDTLAPAALVAA